MQQTESQDTESPRQESGITEVESPLPKSRSAEQHHTTVVLPALPSKTCTTETYQHVNACGDFGYNAPHHSSITSNAICRVTPLHFPRRLFVEKTPDSELEQKILMARSRALSELGSCLSSSVYFVMRNNLSPAQLLQWRYENHDRHSILALPRASTERALNSIVLRHLSSVNKASNNQLVHTDITVTDTGLNCPPSCRLQTFSNDNTTPASNNWPTYPTTNHKKNATENNLHHVVRSLRSTAAPKSLSVVFCTFLIVCPWRRHQTVSWNDESSPHGIAVSELGSCLLSCAYLLVRTTYQGRSSCNRTV